MLGSAVAVRVVRGSRLTPAAQELTAGLLAIAPALLSLRGTTRRVPRRRAHLDRQLRARRAARAGARALRLAPDRAADRDDRRGERARGHGAAALPRPPPAQSLRSARLPWRPSSSAGWCAIPRRSSRGRSRSPGTSSSTARDERAERRSSSRSPRRRSSAASSSKRRELSSNPSAIRRPLPMETA